MEINKIYLLSYGWSDIHFLEGEEMIEEPPTAEEESIFGEIPDHGDIY